MDYQGYCCLNPKLTQTHMHVNTHSDENTSAVRDTLSAGMHAHFLYVVYTTAEIDSYTSTDKQKK